MGQKLEIENENQVIQLYSNKKREWEDKTSSVSTMFKASHNGNVTGYDIYFKGSEKNFLIKKKMYASRIKSGILI